MSERLEHIRSARVYLAEACRRRQHRGGFFFTLLQWAANARRRAAACARQRDLFEVLK